MIAAGWLLPWFAVLTLTPAQPGPEARIGALFQAKGVTGTLAIASLEGDQLLVHNPDRAAQRFCPASTFKIPNTLIAFDSGVLADEEEMLKWDGTKQPFPDWEKDHNLASAFAVSCVWFYQQIATKVGLQKYAEYLKKFDYGNQSTGKEVTTFWLDDSLQISAMEQLAFLKRLLKQELGVSKHAYDTLRTVMRVPEVTGCELWAKTGWALRVKHPVGWYVGYAQSGGSSWVFALNMDMDSIQQAPLRKAIVLEALKLAGICNQ